ncbi:hypothetical protein AGMMS49957_02210 [Synergistales bacterium]|nr:hypothetical protein AGMMS49957_02210 [Synergistales bacterium]
MNEAVIALCKCKKNKKLYGVRFERTSMNAWQYTWAFPIKEATARREGYEGTTITGNVEPAADYPGCPYCGSKYFVVCQCGKLNCNISDSGLFTCEWCGMTGELTIGIGDGIKTGKDR